MKADEDQEAFFAWWDGIDITDYASWIGNYQSLTKEQQRLLNDRAAAKHATRLAAQRAAINKLNGGSDDDIR